MKKCDKILCLIAGMRPQDGVPDMTVISDIDEYGINQNLHVRYQKDLIYVRTSIKSRKTFTLSLVN